MTAKEYLTQLYKAMKEKQIIQNRIDDLTIQAGYGTGRSYARNISGTDHHCPMEEALMKAWELSDELEERLAEQDAMINSITKAIETVPDDVCRSVLHMRYAQCRNWSKIAELMRYSEQRIYELHGKALLMVVVPRNAK